MTQFDLKSATYEKLTEYIVSIGEKPFRAKQLYEWMHVRHAASIDEMTNLSKNLRAQLKEQCSYTVLSRIDVQTSKQDGTRKYLFGLSDGNMIESVLMRYKHGNSVCISSQAGCRMGCRFCASTQDGLARNLTPAEMLEQVYRIGSDIGERISNVVVMGSGEPLDNYDNLLDFIKMLTDAHGLNISQRNLTVSTCGLVPRMRELADLKLQITLALSLHASTQEKRRALMPVADKYELSEVMEACDYYFAQTGRRMTFEYALVGGINDTDADADELCDMLKGKNCHINLIPVNPIQERDYVQSERAVVEAFMHKLEREGINVTVRREMGRDIDGACGQLRKRHMDLANSAG